MTQCPHKPLPIVELCNRRGIPNPILGYGELGNESDNRMDYCGLEKHELVKILQLILNILMEEGKIKGLPEINVNGIFGKETECAVIEFQRNHYDWDNNPLVSDGLVGPRTADALNKAVMDRCFPDYKTPDRVKE